MLRFLICAGLAIALMIMNEDAPFFKKWRADMDLVVLPIQYIVDWPIKTAHALAMRLTTQQQLLEDNAKLRAHELLLQAKLQQLLVLERENAQLRQLLQSTQHVGGKVLVGQILAVDLNPNLHQVIVDRGEKENLYIGQPVLDSYGVMGQVVDVGPHTSKVMLATDPKSAIPVQDYRDGVRAIAVGDGVSGQLHLVNMPDTSDIKVGDLFVASGLGLHFPPGYPVGVVTTVSHSSGDRYADIAMNPAAHLDQTQQVLLAWPSKLSFTTAVQEEMQAKLVEPSSIAQPNSAPANPAPAAAPATTVAANTLPTTAAVTTAPPANSAVPNATVNSAAAPATVATSPATPHSAPPTLPPPSNAT